MAPATAPDANRTSAGGLLYRDIDERVGRALQHVAEQGDRDRIIGRKQRADLARLAAVASRDPLLSALTTSPGFEVALGNHFVQFNNTNRLVHEPSWSIGLQKTGYISEAGQCLVMQSKVNGRNVVMVFLDSASTRSRIADAQRVRSWMEDRSMAVAHRAD